MDRLVEIFDKKDLEVSFQELAQLKQIGNLEYFIGEFQQLTVMVPNILEHRLIVLFIEGLSEPWRGWIKAFDLISLQEAMKKARSMEHAVPTNKFQSKGESSSKDNKPFYKTPERNDFKNDSKDKTPTPFDTETLNDVRNKH